MHEFNFKRVASYGCSFTAGSELTDHEVIGITEDELYNLARKNKFTGSYQIYDYYQVDGDTRTKILHSNRSRSWPNYIAAHYNVPSLNRATPGASLSYSTFCLLRDIHDGIILPTDFIVVGVTSPTRWFQFDSSGQPVLTVFGHGGSIPCTLERELEAHWVNLYNVIYTHTKELLFLSNLSDNMNGQIKLCFTLGSPSFVKHQLRADLQENEKSLFFEFCEKLVPPHHFLDLEVALCELAGIIDYKTHHTFSHPRVHIHKKFANSLIKGIDRMYSGK
jgi:hypothetical protein